MKAHHTIKAGAALAVLLALGTALPATAAVTVTFVQPDNYRDLPFSQLERERLLKDFGEYFAKLETSLPAGQDLRIDVLDMDMAGRIVPTFRAGQDLRVLRGGADWPHMKLRYTLSANGQVLSSGEEMLSDMSYLNHINKYSDGDSLRYEKRMVDEWFNKKFKASSKG